VSALLISRRDVKNKYWTDSDCIKIIVLSDLVQVISKKM
jgi:hypothetical protein